MSRGGVRPESFIFNRKDLSKSLIKNNSFRHIAPSEEFVQGKAL